MRARQVAVIMALLVAAVIAGGAEADEPELDPGCDPQTPVVAHLQGSEVLDPQPEGGPIACRMYTGFAGGEGRINVTNSGSVIYSPAPQLRGIASIGLGDTGLVDGPQEILVFDRRSNQRQWMFQKGGIAVSRDNGATWTFVRPHNMTWVMDDLETHVDRDTGRFFFSNLTPSPYPQLQRGAISVEEQTPLPLTIFAPVRLGPSHILTSADDGLTWSHATTCCAIADRVWFQTAKAPPGQPEPALYPNVAYYIHPSEGGTVSRSLDAGLSWEVVGNITSGETAGCSLADSRMGTHVAADTQGFLYVAIGCDDDAILARSTDAGATWHRLRPLPNAGAIRFDGDDNMYMVRLVDNERILLSVSVDLGETWSDDADLTAPGVVGIHRSWFFEVREPGHLVVSYHGQQATQTTFDGYMTVTRDALSPDPVFWSAMVNDPDIPLLYGNTLMGVSGGFPPLSPPQIDHIGADIAPDGSAWASFTEDCGPDPEAPRCQAQNVQTRGLATRLVWP